MQRLRVHAGFHAFVGPLRPGEISGPLLDGSMPLFHALFEHMTDVPGAKLWCDLMIII